jgi:hypothetical protein
MGLPDRLREWRPAACFKECRIEPFRHRRHLFQAAADRLAQHLARQAFGQAVDRLVQWHVLARRGDEIGMRHLQPVVEAFYPPRDDPLAADRQRLVQPVGMGVEEHQLDHRGVVGAAHAIWLRFHPGREMVEHVHRHGGDAALFGADQLRLVGAVDHPHRQVEHQVLQPRPRHRRDQFLQPRPHPR